MSNKGAIRALNDDLRRYWTGGIILMSAGVAALSQAKRDRIIQSIAEYDDFSPTNDPYQEHDFGVVKLDLYKVFFKIDCYDTSMTMGSPDPADPSVTERVLTIMLAEEY